MTPLSDPRPAPPEPGHPHQVLAGLVGLAELVRGLAGGPTRPGPAGDDRLVDALLGLVSLGEAVERLAGPAPPEPAAGNHPPEPAGWLR